jgi:MFS family permease
LNHSIITRKTSSELTPRSLAVVGTVLVAAGLSGATVAPSALAVFMAPISAETGWGRGHISIAASICYVSVSVSAFVLGPYIDRFGARAVQIPLTLLSAAAMFSFAILGRSILMFYAAFVAVGLCAPGAIPYSKMLSVWFDRRRGFMLGMLGVGLMISNVVTPQIAEVLFHAVGWRVAFAAFGAALLLICLPLVLLFFRERPQVAEHARTQSAAAPSMVFVPEITTMQALRTRSFWMMAGAQVFASAVFMAMLTHSVGILVERGLPREQAVTGLSVLAAGSLVAQIMTGYLLDRIDRPQVIVPFAITAVVGAFLIHFGQGTWVIMVGMGLLGVGCGSETSMMSYFVTRFFGVRNFSRIYGVLLPVLVLTSAPAPILLGTIFDATGSYRLAMPLIEGALVATALLFFLLEPYRFPVTAQWKLD